MVSILSSSEFIQTKASDSPRHSLRLSPTRSTFASLLCPFSRGMRMSYTA